MMRENGKLKYLFIGLLFTILLPMRVFASNNIVLEVDKNDLEVGDIVTVTAKLPENSKLYAFTATLSYDKAVFEEIDDTDFEIEEDSLSIVYNSQNNQFGIINQTGEIEEELFTIHLKVKKDAMVGDTDITLTNVSSSDGSSKITYEKSSVSVLVTRDAKEGEVPPTSVEKEEEQEEQEKVIKTFSTKPIMIGLGVIFVLLVGTTIFVVVKKKEKKKLLAILIGSSIIVAFAFTSLFVLQEKKKDVNDDGKQTYDDAKEIMKYLIDIQGTKTDEEKEETPSKDKSDYDINNDGKVDINDAAGSVQQTTEEVKYKVTLEEKNKEEVYVQRGKIYLEFSAKVTNNVKIKEIEIDGKYYPVTYQNDTYMVALETPSEAGKITYHITKVKLANHREVKVDFSILKEVLKEKPYLDMFAIGEDGKSFHFKLEDKDHAFIDGFVQVIDDKGQEVIHGDISEENEFHYDFEEDITYGITVVATYDLDSDTKDEKNHYEDVILYSHQLTVTGNYEFSLTDVTITDAIEKGETPILTFQSKNNKGYKVDYIVVDGKEYDVTAILEDGRYQVELKGIDTSSFGKYHVQIDEVVLESLKDFHREKDYETNALTYYILKYAPVVENIKLKDNEQEKTIEASYQFVDDDSTLKQLNAVLVDSTNKVVDRKEDIDPKKPVTLSYKDNVDGRYRVKFLADCNLGTERHNYIDKNIGEDEILTQVEVYVESATVKTVFPTKGQPQYTITYKVRVSDSFKSKYNYNELAGVTINGLNYDGNKQSGEYTSAISFTVPSESGVVNLTVDRVKLRYETYQGNSHAFFSVQPYTTQIDVLKDKPTIENLVLVSEDYGKREATFEFEVVDDNGGFIQGEVELDGQKYPIHKGKNTVTFTEVIRDELFTLNFRGDYDLDTNTLAGYEEKENRFENDLLYTVPYGLYGDSEYENIELTNLKTTSKKNSSYFEKEEDVNLSFELQGLEETLDLTIDKIVVGEKEIAVRSTKDKNRYEAILDSYSKAGIKTVEITGVIFHNGKRVTLKTPAQVSLEVLKDDISIYDYKYTVEEKDIAIHFYLKDTDSALLGKPSDMKVKVYDEDGKLLEELPYQEDMKISKKENVTRYYVQVYGDYDRDITRGNDNYYPATLLLDEVISTEKNYIQMKDITDISLYREMGGKITLQEEVDVDSFLENLEDYFVKVSMTETSPFYASIQKAFVEGDKLILILDYEYVQKDKEQPEVRIEFGTVIDGKVRNSARPESFEEWIERVKENPDGTFTLTHDLDASSYTTLSKTLVEVEFTGTIDGNGHTIRNLSKPLFNIVRGGTIRNLKLEDVALSEADAGGAIANTTYNATLSGILVDGLTKKNSNAGFGGLVGRAENTTIEMCRIKGLNIGIAIHNQRIGGIAGTVKNSTIKNTYVIGTMSGGWNFRGAIAGIVENTSTFENNYTKVSITSGYDGNLACDIACGGSAIYKNNISLNTGGIKNRITNGAKEAVQNYYVGTETTSREGITAISQEEITKELFKKASYDEEIWNLKEVSYEKTPTLNIEKVTKIDIDEVGDAYDENKEILYQNLMMLMPFYDSTKIVKSALNIPADSLLATEEIMHLVPVDKKGNIVTYLTSKDPKKIQKIKIVFKNNQKVEYEVRYDTTYDMVASYRIPELKIDYTYHRYIIDSDSQLVNNLTNYLSSLTYADHLDKLTATADSRLYGEFYDEVTKKEIKEFVLKYLSNSEYTNTNHSEVINDYLETEIKKDQKLERMLYVYNYFRRFYDVEIDGIRLYDLILFNSQGFSKKLTPDEIASLYLSDDKNFQTNATSDAYARTLGKYTGYQNIPAFLEYLVKSYSNLSPEKWYASQFKGYLVEIAVDGRKDIQYTLWDHIKTPDLNTKVTWYNYALPIITLPKNAGYIISTPVQFVIGAQRTYTPNPDDPEEQAKFRHRVQTYATRMIDYYATAAKLIDNATVFNNIHTIELDKRYAYDENGNFIFQNPYTTQEPFHKNFNEVIGQFAYNDYNAATANGAYVLWRVEGILDGDLDKGIEYTFHTWSHETAHNIDARLFLMNYGRRFDAGGEDYADGNLTQSFGDGDIVMNLSRHFAKNSLISANLDISRIDSPTEIQDFYEKLFDTLYILDYLEGRALLTLTPEQQSKLVVQASYPNMDKYPIEDKPYYKNYLTTVYQTISEEQIQKMNLTKIEDLTKNQLVMYPGVIYSTIIDNRYGGENIYKVRWYQPHNDYGRPDSYSLKWLAYEMLGYAGYQNGYLEYYSNIHSEKKTFANVDDKGNYVYDNNGNKKTSTVDYKTDLMALRTITKNQNMTFESYKKMRFKKVEENLSYIQEIDVDQVYQDFIEALQKDAEAVKQAEEEALKRYPGTDKTSTDNRNKIIAEARKYKYSSEVRRKYYYQLKNQTNDFVNEVYNKKNPHTVTLQPEK